MIYKFVFHVTDITFIMIEVKLCAKYGYSVCPYQYKIHGHVKRFFTNSRYTLMLRCWKHSPILRPSMHNLQKELGSMVAKRNTLLDKVTVIKKIPLEYSNTDYEEVSKDRPESTYLEVH